MVKNTKKPNQWRLMSRWTCDLANKLYSESMRPMTHSTAFRQAHLTRRILERLGQGVVTFVYVKKDGTERRATGTLCSGIDPLLDSYEYKNGGHQDVKSDKPLYTYWDLELHAFRTFSAEHVVSIEGEDIDSE